MAGRDVSRATERAGESAGATPLGIEHVFRHQAGRIVARLTHLLGPAHVGLAEDAAQEAMLRALQSWPYQGVPDNAAGWLFRVAHNIAIDVVRRDRTFGDIRDRLVGEIDRSSTPPPDVSLEDELRDDELRMIVMCCHPEIPREAAVALSLKTVGGFGVREIARALLADERAISQRIVRAKRQIRERGLTLDLPHGDELASRVDLVLEVLYLMFNEGYTAHEGEDLIRTDLCMEALRLGRIIADSGISRPRVSALVALLAFQAARLPARVNDSGDLILLADQDRSRWDDRLIAIGLHYFDRSMVGDEVSVYHAQAAIAATHARPLDPRTLWPLVLQLYDQLLALNPSPVVVLNRAVALSRVHGPAVALGAIDPLDHDPALRNYYLRLAVRGHLLMEMDRNDEAVACFRAALECGCSEPERRFLRSKIQALGAT